MQLLIIEITKKTIKITNKIINEDFLAIIP